MTIIINKELLLDSPIINHIHALAFDRSAGSTGETKAINYIQKDLLGENINSKVEYFSWSTPIRILMRTVYLMALAYLLVFRLFLIIVAFYFGKYLFQKTRRYSFTHREQSKNVLVKIPATNKESKPSLIIFSAHYDSISSRIPRRMQVILSLIIKLIILPYMGLSIFISVWLVLNIFAITDFNLLLFYLITICSIITLSVLVPGFLVIFSSNKSTGSIDNASGVSILMELVKKVSANPLRNYDVLFIWFGAEEWGLKGSKKFVSKYKNKFMKSYDLDHSILINIDMVGSYIGLLDKYGIISKNSINKNLNQLIENTAKELNLPIARYEKKIKPKSDYIPFKKLQSKTSFQIACFHSDKDSIYIHSKSDTPDRCSNEILNNCLKICYRTIEHLDARRS